MDKKKAINLLRLFGKAFNNSDIEGILNCVTEDFEWRLSEGSNPPHGRIVSGKSEVRAALKERDRITQEIKFSETSVYFTEDTAFGCFRAIGTMKDGTKVDHRGIDIYKFRGGENFCQRQLLETDFLV